MKQTLLIFDIKNNRSDYAITSKIIATLESLKSTKETENIFRELLKLTEKVAISVVQTSNKVMRFREIGIIKNGEFENSDVSNSRTLARDAFDFKKENYRKFWIDNSSNFKYHIRAHMSNDKVDIANLHYLALLLKCHENLIVDRSDMKKKLGVFIVPPNFDEKEISDKIKLTNELFNNYSKYLRLLSKEFTGVIYGLEYDSEGNQAISPLNFNIVQRIKNHFPIIKIDAKETGSNLYNTLFEQQITEEELNELFSRKIRHRDANNKNPNIALKDLILETSFAHIKEVIDLNSSILESLKHLLAGFDRVTIALFSFLLSESPNITDNGHPKDKYSMILNLAKEINLGLTQVVQNSLQYSQEKMCLFSFSIQDITEKLTESKYYKLNEIIKRNFTKENYSKIILDIKVSDINFKESFSCTFTNNLKKEKSLYDSTGLNLNLTGYDKLIANKNLQLRNFFNCFEEKDDLSTWYDFRSSDSTAHIGLVLLAQMANKLSANIDVISNQDYLLHHKNTFEKQYGFNQDDKTTGNKSSDKKEEYVFPGTEFQLCIPVIPAQLTSPLGVAQLEPSNIINNNYEAFAQYIDFDYNNLNEIKLDGIDDVCVNAKYRDMQDSNSKILTQIQWYTYWKNIFTIIWGQLDNKSIHEISLKELEKNSYFQNKVNCEIFLKGMFSALKAFETDKNIYLVLKQSPQILFESISQLGNAFALKSIPPNLQIVIVNEPFKNQIILTGPNLGIAIQNAYSLNLEYDAHGVNAKDCRNSVYMLAPFRSCLKNINNTKVNIIPLFTKEYFNWLQQIADNDIELSPSANKTGYKFNDTHLRLGNKVHIESFYEMSFLFYRTGVANRIAFAILTDIFNNRKDINLLEDEILIYGYASYSQALLVSITEMIKTYRKLKSRNQDKDKDKDDDKVSYAIYQYNLQSESNPENIQIFFSKDKIENTQKVIQIVPISSTLTTFEKMWSKLLQNKKIKNVTSTQPVAHYTAFWVRDKKGVGDNPSFVESKYWNKAITIDNNRYLIETGDKLKILDAEKIKINYFMKGTANWLEPINCNLCFPEFAYDELPLIETDQTSTVPAQQISYVENKDGKTKNVSHDANNNRMLKLVECCYYGHIKRAKNHYQFYIDTQKYFLRSKQEIRTWLKTEREKSTPIDNNIYTEKFGFPVLNVIFAPEHNSNVGFAQYVNAFYFNGMAEVVSINQDKKFRSNFMCENTALINKIKRLFLEYDNFTDNAPPVKFFFVDDMIITGDTYRRAESLMRSLLPPEQLFRYKRTVFEKCFILINRLSRTTKYSFVKEEKDFISFCNINISNIRRQGDSCVVCKLKVEAEKLYKRSSTKNISNFWYKKYLSFKDIPFYDTEKMELFGGENAFIRLTLSHIIRSVFSDNCDPHKWGEFYDRIISILRILLKAENYKNDIYFQKFSSLFNKISKNDEKDVNINGHELLTVKIFLKLISRPFFSYDFRFKSQVLKFLILLSESLLSGKVVLPEIKSNICNEPNAFLFEENRIDKTRDILELILSKMQDNPQLELSFIKECVFDSLTDLNSTFLLRKETISKTYNYLKNKNSYEESCSSISKTCSYRLSEIDCYGALHCFWNCYAANIHRIIDSSSDEVKSLRLEHLLTYAEDYQDEKKNKKITGLYLSIRDKSASDELNGAFKHFCCQVFLQNTRIIFDGLEKDYAKNKHYDGNISNSYLMKICSKFNKLNQYVINKNEDNFADNSSLLGEFKSCEKKLYEELCKNENIDHRIDKRYKKFTKIISEIITEKYQISNHEIAILTQNLEDENEENVPNYVDLDFVNYLNPKESTDKQKNRQYDAKHNIKTYILEQLKQKDLHCLIHYGYWVSEDETHFILYFDNPEIAPEVELKRRGKKIVPVFIYIKMDLSSVINKTLSTWMIMRSILMYRNSIMKYLEEDFDSDAMSKRSRDAIRTKILLHEKSVAHSDSKSDENIIKVWTMDEQEKKDFYEAFINNPNEPAKWLLLKNYVNNQIAKIFNRSFERAFYKNSENDHLSPKPKLYVKSDYNTNNRLLQKAIENFNDLGFKNKEDKRFEMLSSVINIKYIDLENAEFISGGHNENYIYYNSEYLICLLFDILFTAIKYGSLESTYLLKINDLYMRLEKKSQESKGVKINEKKDKPLSVYFLREITSNEKFDYLVILNKVNSCVNNISKQYKSTNKTIAKILLNPLDYHNGHMSLISIKTYIENLESNTYDIKDKSSFQYILERDLKERYKTIFNSTENDDHSIWFETKLPILKKGEE